MALCVLLLSALSPLRQRSIGEDEELLLFSKRTFRVAFFLSYLLACGILYFRYSGTNTVICGLFVFLPRIVSVNGLCVVLSLFALVAFCNDMGP